MKKILFFCLTLTIFTGCARCASVKKSSVLLGTIIEITVADTDQPLQVKDKAIKEAFAEIARVERALSRFKPDSEISRINSSAQQKPLKVAPETIRLIEKSIEFSRLTGGAFDITIQPLTKIWQAAKEQKRDLPGISQLEQALGSVGYQNIKIIKDKQLVFLLHPGMGLDLGGIAKGYAVDRAIQVLKNAGIQNALVNAGGDIYALGRPNPAKKWQIAVQHPRNNNSALTVLAVQDQAVATSGDYQNYIQTSKRRFSHIIDPNSGQPCSEATASVTVLSKDCLSADALATAVSVLGPEKGMDLINQLEDTETVIAGFRKGKLEVYLSCGLQQEGLQLSACTK